MINIDPSIKKQVETLAESIQVSPEEYLKNIISQHSEKSQIKDILLEDQEGFSQFLTEYNKVIDALAFIRPETTRIIGQKNVNEQMIHVFKELGFLISRDSTLLTHLYQVYKKS